MSSDNEFQRSILIPQSRYHQLLQYQQNKASTAIQTAQKATQYESSSNPNDENLNSLESSCARKELLNNRVVLNQADDHENEIYRKLLHIISNRFPNSVGKKMKRLLLFIRDFGSHLISFHENGNVLIRKKVISRTSSVLDLLEACVTDSGSPKLSGYSIFVKALTKINVPRHFLGNSNLSMRKKNNIFIRKSKIKNWQPY